MSAAAFLKARDFLLAHREDYERAYRDFRWPALDRFNWALDYFDPMARGNDRLGLWIVDEVGAETRLTFAELAARSSRVANHLRGLGVRRGDRLLLMLGNVAPLWECMLAAMKLGAVIVPATTLLEPRRPCRPVCPRPGPPRRDQRRQYRQIRRARRRLHADRGRWGRARLGSLGGGLPGVGAFFTGWRDQCLRPALALFHLGHDGQAEARAAQPSELSGRSSDSNVLAGRAAGRHPPQYLVAGLGQACLELLLCAVERGGDGVHAEPAALQREGAARGDRALRGDDVLRTADRVADADPGRPRGVEGRAEGGRRRRRAAQPGDHRTGAGRLGADCARRLRPDRDDLADRQFPGTARQTRIDGPGGAGLSRAAASAPMAASRTRPRCAWRSTRRP